MNIFRRAARRRQTGRRSKTSRACRSRLSHRLSRSSPGDGPRRVAGEAGQAAGEADSDRQTETRATMGLLEDAIATYSYVGLWISLSEKKSLE